MTGHAQLEFVMTECSKTQIRLTGLKYYNIILKTKHLYVRLETIVYVFNVTFVYVNLNWPDHIVVSLCHFAGNPSTMAGYSLEEFRVVPCHHFLFSALCFAGFATGYIHTRETNLEGRFPYFVCGAILGGIVSTLCNAILCQDQDSLLVKRRNDNHSPGPVIRELVPSSHQRKDTCPTVIPRICACGKQILIG